ncbi:hypothetical protein [Blastococcus sp. SYSU D01042]
MRRFISPTTPLAGDFAQVGEDEWVRQTPGYLELVKHASPEAMISVYWLPLSGTDFLVATCWLQDFDFPLHMLSGADRAVSLGSARSMAVGWPWFTALLQNSLSEQPQFSAGVLLRLPDPDTGDTVWLIGKMLGNYRMEQFSDMTSGRSLDLANEVCSLSAEIGSEQLATPYVALPDLALNIGKAVSDVRRERAAQWLVAHRGEVARLTLDTLVGLVTDG